MPVRRPVKVVKFKLKLSRREMDLLIGFIEQNYPNRPATDYGKLLEGCLAELLHKLKAANIIIKNQYKVGISAPAGLGFLLYCRLVAQHGKGSCIETENAVRKVLTHIQDKSA